MFSNATYANFTIGEDTIILTLDANASFDGVCNLTDIMGTEISAAGSYAEFEYFPVTYQNVSYDEKWSVHPWFDHDLHQLNLLRGSGIITTLNLELRESGTEVPKLVGVGGLTGNYHIETEAEGLKSTDTYLLSSLAGVGYADLYAQYAYDTSFDDVTFIPTFSECEQLQLTTNTSGSSIWYYADVLGLAHEPEYLDFDTIPLDNVAITGIFDLTYHPVNISEVVFDELWSVKPEQYDDTLVILRGTGTMTTLNFIYNDSTAAHPEISSYSYLRGDCNVTADIFPHYMSVVATGPDVAAMDESGEEGFGITFGIAPPEICTDPDPPSHDFGEVPEGETRNWTFDIINCGGGTLIWNVSDDQPWITVSPPNGTTTATTATATKIARRAIKNSRRTIKNADTVTVTIDTTDLECGITHTGTINISSNGGTKEGIITVYVLEPEFCCAEVAVCMAGVPDPDEILNPLRELRDGYLKAEYVDRYYDYGTELTMVMKKDPALAYEAARLLVKYSPMIQHYVTGTGKVELITGRGVKDEEGSFFGRPSKGKVKLITGRDVAEVVSFTDGLKSGVMKNRGEIGATRSQEIINYLDEFKEQVEASEGKTFSEAFQSSIYFGSD